MAATLAVVGVVLSLPRTEDMKVYSVLLDWNERRNVGWGPPLAAHIVIR